MDEKLTKLLDQNSHKFHDWVKTINEHNAMSNPDSNLTKEQKFELVDKTAEVLAQISELYFKYGAFKDKFDNSKMSLDVYGLHIFIESKKIGCVFQLGIDEKGFYLSTYMRYAKNLRHMDDNFYKEILSLMELGEFELQENERYGNQVTSKYEDLYKNQKSKIFRILRNYFVGLSEKEINVLLGEFLIYWPYDTAFSDVIYNSCLAFKKLYRLNYSLWKVTDLQTKN